jgi:hypothetical protein
VDLGAARAIRPRTGARSPLGYARSTGRDWSVRSDRNRGVHEQSANADVLQPIWCDWPCPVATRSLVQLRIRTFTDTGPSFNVSESRASQPSRQPATCRIPEKDASCYRFIGTGQADGTERPPRRKRGHEPCCAHGRDRAHPYRSKHVSASLCHHTSVERARCSPGGSGCMDATTEPEHVTDSVAMRFARSCMHERPTMREAACLCYAQHRGSACIHSLARSIRSCLARAHSALRHRAGTAHAGWSDSLENGRHSSGASDTARPSSLVARLTCTQQAEATVPCSLRHSLASSPGIHHEPCQSMHACLH